MRRYVVIGWGVRETAALRELIFEVFLEIQRRRIALLGPSRPITLVACVVARGDIYA